MNKKLIALLIGLIIIISAKNIFAQAQQQTKWKGKISTGLMFTKGNVDYFKTKTEIEVKKYTTKNKIRFKLEYIYGENEDIKQDEYLSVSQGFEQRITDTPLFMVMDSRLEYDYALEIERRLTGNPGIGLYLLENGKGYLSIDAGPSYSIEKKDNQEIKDNVLYRARQKCEYAFNEHVDFYEEIVLLSEVDDTDDYRIEGRAEIATRLISNLSLITTVYDKYQNQPPAGIERNDLGGIVSVGYQF